jgi:2-oxo-4-hydroxy-4-carboxy-5-ureidoimidazoline decarboxylase
MRNVRTDRTAGFNALRAADAEAALLACCASPVFARAVAAGRPYADAADLVAAVGAAVRGLDWPQVLAALAAHPRIGERPVGSGREFAWSRAEQSGVDGAGDEVRARLAEGNRAYEERFGHVYLICATGLSAEEMLARLTERLAADEESERATVREELAKIACLRAARLLGEEPTPAALPDTAAAAPTASTTSTAGTASTAAKTPTPSTASTAAGGSAASIRSTDAARSAASAASAEEDL